MYRKQELDLQHWIQKKNRKPLVIRGARQVGKSTLVRQFCAQNGIQLFEINLEKHMDLDKVFASKNIKKIISSIEDVLEIKISVKNSLLFLDEIQSCPSVLQSLRYFYEEMPDLAVVSAGSLLEFLLNDYEYPMPVGRIEFMYIGPMTFAEFLMAKNENFIIDKLSQLKDISDISAKLHQKALILLREFLFVGGMPEAIKIFLENEDYHEVRRLHSQILQTYQDDFVKYAKKNHLQKIQKVFQYIYQHPCQKIKYTNISKEDLSRDLKLNLQLLEKAKVISFVFHCSCSGLPVQASENENIFKTLVLDVGLMNAMQGLQWKSLQNSQEHELLMEGAMAEQFIGQHLLFQGPNYEKPHLNYWLREGKTNNAEIDYVVEYEGRMIAVEVKAGAAGKIRSLHQWQHDIKFKKKSAVRFNQSTGGKEEVSYTLHDRIVKYPLLTMPLYFVDWWRNLL